MKKYFYTDGVNSFGPYTLEELKANNVTKETLVWFQELGDWKPAGMVPELSSLFDPTFVPPPPKFESTGGGNFGNTTNAGNTNSGYSNQKPPFASANLGSKPPKTWLAESILVTLFCCWPFGIPAIVNAAKVENRFYAGDIEGSMRASDAAKKWTLLSFWLGLAIIVLYIILMSFGLLGGLFFL